MPELRLGIGDLNTSLTTIYTVPAETVVRIAVAHFCFGTAGNMTVKMEDDGGISHFLMNAVPIAANTSFELRDLVLEPEWKLKAFSSVAGNTFNISGTEVTPVPSSPQLKVFAKTTLNSSMGDIFVVPTGKRAYIKHWIWANGSTGQDLSIDYVTAGSVTAAYRNEEPKPAHSVVEDFDVPPLEAGDKIRAKGVGDFLLFGQLREA